MTNEEMFNNNIKIAYKIASKYKINYLKEYEDIKQIALMALWKAVIKFNYKNAFSTFAYVVISNEINCYLRENKNNKFNISINTEIYENLTIFDVIEEKENSIEKIEETIEKEKIEKIKNEELEKMKKSYKQAYKLLEKRYDTESSE